jgi:hypothetical protein
VTKYVLAQHYFTVPLQVPDSEADPNDDASMRMSYVSVPFEIVCPSSGQEEDVEAPPRKQPLLAIDFGRAVWLEYVRAADDEEPYERGADAGHPGPG